MFIRSSKASVEYKPVGFKDDALKAAMEILFNLRRCPVQPLDSASSKYPITLCQLGNAVIKDRNGCSKVGNPPHPQVRRARTADRAAKTFPNCM